MNGVQIIWAMTAATCLTLAGVGVFAGARRKRNAGDETPKR